MNELLDKLILEVMHYEARTGKRDATVSLTSEYLKKLSKSDKYFVRAEGYIAGIKFYIDNEQKEDYIIK